MHSEPSEISRLKSTDKWACEICSFENLALLPNCEMCDTRKPGSIPKAPHSPPSGFECHSCQHLHSKLAAKCDNCGETLIPDDLDDEDSGTVARSSKKIQDSTKLLSCPHCSFQNDPSNTTCVSCEQTLIEPLEILTGRRRARKPYKPRKPRAHGRAGGCPYCGTYIGVGVGISHDVCPKMPKAEMETIFRTINRSYCTFCYEKMKTSEEMDAHDLSCASRKEFFALSNPTFDRTTKLQRDTIIYMHEKSEKFHWISEPYLVKRIEAMGYKASDLENLHHYIVNYAPIIIHMHANNHMQFFVKDTHYRNQFETKKSSGSLSETSRTSWEDRMFDGLHHSATPFERVKYGTINFTNDPKGVRACTSYGQSYFLLKPHVRNRCTFTDMDSSSPSSTISTFQFCYNVLNKLPDAQLKAAFDGSKANEVASMVIGSYKQIQIHGPVEFKKDIERVYLNKNEMTDPKILEMVKEFCRNNELDYEIFEPEAPPGGHPFLGASLFSHVPAPAPVPSFAFGHGASLFGHGSSVYGRSPSVFMPPVPRPSTAHLFRGRGHTGLFAGSRAVEEEELEEGVDYI